MCQKISVIGGDLRQIYAAKKLEEQGYEVTLYGFDGSYLMGLSGCSHLSQALSESDCVLLPFPVSRDQTMLSTPLWEQTLSLDEVFSGIPDSATVFCGMSDKLPPCYQHGIVDYGEDEAFLLKNAYLTAEAALGIVISQTKISLQGASVLITGYGRIGGFLAKMLKNLGAKTYVASRRSYHLAEIELVGCIPVSHNALFGILSEMDVVLNTVPVVIFDEWLIQQISKKCLFVDLASLPGGIDQTVAKNYGVEVLHALSLPGKVAPITSGKIVADTIVRLLSKKIRNKE